MSQKIGHGASVRRGEGIVVKGCGMHGVEVGQKVSDGWNEPENNNKHLWDSRRQERPKINGKYFETQP